MRFLTPRHALGAVLTLMLLLCVGMAYAGTVTLTWTNPTTRTDGSAVTVAQVKVYRGATCATQAVVATIPAATTYVDTNVPAGTYCYAVSALDANGLESAKSATATAVVPVAPPSPPTGLSTVATVAYDVKWSQRDHRFVLNRKVGDVPLGTPCNACFQMSGGYAQITPEAIAFTRPTHSALFVAKCGAV